MKITAIILLSACLSASANGFSQQVTIVEKNVKLEKIFLSIKTQTGYKFLYTDEMLEGTVRVTVDLKNVSLVDALNVCFANQPLTYTIIEKTIVVKHKVQETIKQPLPAPPITVRGRVVNEQGEGVAASVVVKGTNNGTSTDAEGNFVLNNVEEDATLVISGVSLEGNVEFKVNGKQDVGSISTKTKVGTGEEILINAGYYKVKQKEATGNISKVTAKQIEKQPVSNSLAALQANVPGLEITQQTGIPGGNFIVRVRGQNSIGNGNDPLYIVNGVPFISTSLSFLETTSAILPAGTSPLNSINPSDIESIEILKDADATAIYGSRGANGVILITTKKGKVGKTKVDFNLYTGSGRMTSKFDLLDTEHYLKMRKEAFKNDNVIPTTTNAPDLLVWDTTRYTDWQKVLLGGTARTLDAHLSISGGEKNTHFSVGGGYHRESSVFPGNNEDIRASIYTNLMNTSSNKKLTTNFSFGYSVNNTDLIKQDLTSLALILPPNAPPLYNSNGELNWGPTAWNGSGFNSNPVRYTKQEYEMQASTLTANNTVSYLIRSALDIKVSLGFTNTGLKSLTTTPRSSLDPVSAVNAQNASTFANNNLQNWIIESQLNWKPKLFKEQLDLLIGSTFLEQKINGFAQFATGFASEALMKDINSASNFFKGSSVYSQYRYQKVFARANYNWDNRYIINLTISRDGSSRFGPGKQFANFGAIGGAWVFSKERFVQKTQSLISYGKIRVSYGTSGNDQIGDYQYLDTYSSSGSGSYLGGAGLSPQRLFNPDFGWEVNRKFEIGMELGFLNDRIFTTFSYYRNRSSNQLVGMPLPPVTGFTSIQSNFPATVQNTGLEVELTSANFQTSVFSWNTSFNISFPRNKLIEFPNLQASPTYASKLVVGEPLTIRKGYQYLNVDPETGIYQFKDVNGDGVYNTADMVSVSFIGRKFYGGLMNSFKYKMFQLDFLFQFVNQGGLSYLVYTSANAPGRAFNGPTILMNRWQNAGDVTNIQRFSSTSGNYQTAYSRLRTSDQFVEDASFIRLKNVSFSYTLPQKWEKKLKAEDIRIFFQGQNLFIITKYKGLDPESANNTLPPLRVLTFGIHLTF